jgi:hypothetical protein
MTNREIGIGMRRRESGALSSLPALDSASAQTIFFYLYQIETGYE